MEMTEHAFCGIDLPRDWESQAVIQPAMNSCWQIQWFKVFFPDIKIVLKVLCGFLSFCFLKWDGSDLGLFHADNSQIVSKSS